MNNKVDLDEDGKNSPTRYDIAKLATIKLIETLTEYD